MVSALAIKQPKADRVFDALGDATRRAIFHLLSRGPLSVSALAQPLGVTLTAVGQHLEILQSCGLLKTRKVGRVRLCEVDGKGLDILEQWVAFHRQTWESRLDRLGDFLEGEKE